MVDSKKPEFLLLHRMIILASLNILCWWSKRLQMSENIYLRMAGRRLRGYSSLMITFAFLRFHDWRLNGSSFRISISTRKIMNFNEFQAWIEIEGVMNWQKCFCCWKNLSFTSAEFRKAGSSIDNNMPDSPTLIKSSLPVDQLSSTSMVIKLLIFSQVEFITFFRHKSLRQRRRGDFRFYLTLHSV